MAADSGGDQQAGRGPAQAEGHGNGERMQQDGAVEQVPGELVGDVGPGGFDGDCRPQPGGFEEAVGLGQDEGRGVGQADHA